MRGLLYKERRQDLTTIKRPQHPHKKVRVTNSSLALQSCKNISDLTFGGCLAGSTLVPFEGISVLFSLAGNGYECKDRASHWRTFRHHQRKSHEKGNEVRNLGSSANRHSNSSSSNWHSKSLSKYGTWTRLLPFFLFRVLTIFYSFFMVLQSSFFFFLIKF